MVQSVDDRRDTRGWGIIPLKARAPAPGASGAGASIRVAGSAPAVFLAAAALAAGVPHVSGVRRGFAAGLELSLNLHRVSPFAKRSNQMKPVTFT